jgi:hypothetical protein
MKTINDISVTQVLHDLGLRRAVYRKLERITVVYFA